MSDDRSAAFGAGEVDTISAALHQLAFQKQQQANSAPAGVALPQLAETPRLPNTTPNPTAPQQRPQMQPQPRIPTWSETQKKSGGRGVAGKLFKLVVLVAILGGGFLGARALMGEEEGGAKVISIPVLDTTGGTGPTDGVPVTEMVTATYALPDPNIAELGLIFQAAHVSVDHTIGDQRFVGLVGKSLMGEFYTQFTQGPPEVVGLDIVGGALALCTKPTGGTQVSPCDFNDRRPAFIEPYLADASIKTFANYVPPLARPFAGATFSGPEDLNGTVRTRYDILVDGAAYQTADPTGYAVWAESLQLDVVGTVHLELWIEDLNRMVWKANYWADGSTTRRSVTVLSVTQDTVFRRPF